MCLKSNFVVALSPFLTKPCTRIGTEWFPQLPCRGLCDTFTDACWTDFEVTLSAFLSGFGGFGFPDCNASVVGGEGYCYKMDVVPGEFCLGFITSGYEVMRDDYKGILRYPEGESTLNDGTSVQCFDPDATVIDFGCMKLKCVEGTVIGRTPSDGSCAECIFPCPSPMYSDHEYEAMWLVYIIPSLISIPANVVLLYALYKPGNKKFRKSKPFHIIACAILGLCFSVLDTTAVAAFYSDLPCSTDTGEPCTNCKGGNSSMCFWNRATIHILQSMFFFMAFMILNVYLSITKGFNSARISKLTTVPCIIVCTVIPIVCAVLTLVLDDDSEDSELALMNNIRAGFKCMPRFSTLGIEWAVIHIWFAVTCVSIVSMIGLIIFRIKQVSREAKSEVKAPMSLIILGSLAASLFILNLIVTGYSAPLLKQYAVDSAEWKIVAFKALVVLS